MKKTIEDAKKWLIENKIEGEFNFSQMFEIGEGLDWGVDVSIYADPKFDGEQMGEIRKGLEEELFEDLFVYADPKFQFPQMFEIREGLVNGVDVTKYADLKFSGDQMEQIRWGLEAGLDISKYADPKFSAGQMDEIRLGLENTKRDKKEKER